MAVPLFCASLAMSLDGFIAREDGGVDWLNDYFTPEIDWEAFSKRFGAVVVGRKTFDQSIARGIPLGGDQPAVVLTHQPLQETPNVSVQRAACGPARFLE